MGERLRILVTGGCGFIGSDFVRHMAEHHPDYEITNLDALTYAGKIENVEGVKSAGYFFVKGDIRDEALVRRLFAERGFDCVVNFAAESHVDNSIHGPRLFVDTNVGGTLNLLDCALRAWRPLPDFTSKRFLQVSTDEVYGSLPENDPSVRFTETTPLDPSSPYSASKASADLLVQAYRRTYGLPTLITRCSNNYGPRQDAEKLIPLMITYALTEKPLPVYGDGLNIRDWLFVRDHCLAIEAVLRRGRPGEVYNVGGDNERRNIDIVKTLLKSVGKPESLIRFVSDRPGHDRRYGIDCSKIKQELGWAPKFVFEQGLQETVQWYRQVTATSKSGV